MLEIFITFIGLLVRADHMPCETVLLDEMRSNYSRNYLPLIKIAEEQDQSASLENLEHKEIRKT